MVGVSKTYKVTSANPVGHNKMITVKSADGAPIALKVHRFAVVGKGDEIKIGAAGANRIFVVSKEQDQTDIPITPSFVADDYVQLGNDRIEIRIKEITTDDEMRSLEFLEQFHYKTNNSLGEEEPNEEGKNNGIAVGGRRAILFAAIRLGERWIPAGYIDLQMPLMMCKPRHELFANPFHHDLRSIRWEKWDQHAMKSYLNTIVRIARIVTTPELRGLGLTRRLIKAAKSFASERWHIGGIKPIFMEISAEMLSHIDFVSSSGFRFIGYTEGNLKRVIKDMEQMSRSPGGEFGMMSLQRKYFRALDDFCKTLNIKFEDGLEYLKRKLESSDNALTAGEWAALRTIIRNPIPYYLCALDDATDRYLKSSIKSISSSAPSKKEEFAVRSMSISIDHLSVRAAYKIPETRSTKLIMDSFGLKGEVVYSDILQDVSVKASNGNIIFIVGSSGSGKSVLLNALNPNRELDRNLTVRGKLPSNYTAGWLRKLREDITVFEALADKYTPERTFGALSRVGLSEALAFIKPFWMLSRGQQYRAMIADLLLRDEEVWLLDEFCSDLDPLTAKVVAHNLRKQVITSGRIAFIAAANHSHYIDALRPSRVLMLRPGDTPAWLSFKDYQSDFLNQAS